MLVPYVAKSEQCSPGKRIHVANVGAICICSPHTVAYVYNSNTDQVSIWIMISCTDLMTGMLEILRKPY